MDKLGWNVLDKVEPMLTGEVLVEKMKILPEYHEDIRRQNQVVRLMELNKIHSFYWPSAMSVEVYTKLYLAMIRSLQKKESKLAIQQRNVNGKNIRACVNGMEPIFGGIIGGSDCFSILGYSGIGKSTTIAWAVQLFNGEQVTEMECMYCKIIPVITVQCPFDCSAKSMLLAILQKIDLSLGTNYYENVVKAKANINTMLISTAQLLLNHVAVLCIDEVQNLIKHKGGMQLCSMLTELLNESGISIVFVGTPEVQTFFESIDYLARRTIGIKYNRCSYDDYFRGFCREMWKYQYVQNKSEISEVVIHWLYDHSAGIIAHVKYLFYTAQEISILNGREVIDLQTLEEAYQKMSMLHMHIQPEINFRKSASSKKVITKKNESMVEMKQTAIEKNTEYTAVQHVTDKSARIEWTFADLAEAAKKTSIDMLSLLNSKISITEVEV